MRSVLGASNWLVTPPDARCHGAALILHDHYGHYAAQLFVRFDAPLGNAISVRSANVPTMAAAVANKHDWPVLCPSAHGQCTIGPPATA